MNKSQVLIGLIALNVVIFIGAWVVLWLMPEPWYQPLKDGLAGKTSTWWIPFAILGGTALLSFVGWIVFAGKRSSGTGS